MRASAVSLAALVAALAPMGLQAHPATPRHLQARRELQPGAGGRHACGNDHPALHKETRAPAVTVPVDYGAGTKGTGNARALSSALQPLNATTGRPIRITAIYDHIDGSATSAPPRVCASAGASATVVQTTGAETPWTCSAKAVPTGDRLVQLQKRIDWAVERFQGSLYVRPTAAAVTVSASVLSQFYLPASRASVADTDLVLIVVAWPSPYVPAAGWAACVQRDQFGRCTVGYINLVPELVDVEGQDSPATITDERHTALHELVHVLGGILPNGGHVGLDGNPLPISSVWQYGQALPMSSTPAATDPKRVAVFIKTPRVLALARSHFNCSTLPGVPLEDLPLGRGSHWEARVLGSELMAYGTASGETYVSDLTAAFLEDTGHYSIPDYAKLTGPLYEESAAPVFDTDGFVRGEDVEGYTPPAPRTPGQLRWGQGGGCGFVLGDPQREWDERHLCLQHTTYGCTPDNRMASVCMLRAGLGVPAQYSCGRRDADGGCDAGPTATGCDSSGANCALPAEMQHFNSTTIDGAFAGARPASASAADLALDRVGGFAAAMDHVPVRFGYWSCSFSSAAANATSRAATESEGGADFDGAVGDSAATSSQFGGQTLCKDCRCFVSSLLEFSKGIQPGAGVYGLCYAHNCYRSDYLQVAVRASDGVAHWYRCPPAGGKIFVPGFSGRLTCPPAKEFCAMETVTGIKYGESGFNLQLIAMYAAAGCVGALFLCCLLPCSRNCMNRCMRKHCSVTVYEQEAFDDTDKVWYKTDDLPDPRKGLVVIVANTLSASWSLFVAAVAGILVVRGALLTATLPFLILGVVVVVLTLMGSVGIRTKTFGPSSLTLVFVYATFLVCCAVVVFASTVALNDSSLRLQVSRNFDLVGDALPLDAYDPTAPVDTQIDQATAYLRAAVVPLGGAVLGGVGLLLVATIAAATTIRKATFAAVTFTFMAWVALLLGLGGIGVGAAISQQTAAAGASGSATLGSPAGIGMGVGAALLVFGVLSLCAMRSPRRYFILTILVVIIAFVAMVGAAAAAGLLVVNRDNVASIVGAIPERQLAVLQDFLGGGLTAEELVEAVEAQLLNIGLMCAAFAIAAAAHFGSGIVLTQAKPFERTPGGPLKPASVVPGPDGGV